MTTFIYKSYADVARDIRNWVDNLPPLSAVAGVPRSGCIVAGMLAQCLQLPLIGIDNILAGTEDDGFRFGRDWRIKGSVKDGKILVLDDVIWRGTTMRHLRPKLAHREDVLLGAVYGSAEQSKTIDHVGYILPHVNHGFEYNLLLNGDSRSACVDMDGVLCHDWGKPDDGCWLEPYENFLVNARPLVKPSHHIFAIVTARLQKYRPQTEAWLLKHGIAYERLIMSPWGDPQQRAKNKGFAEWKAQIYKDLFRNSPSGARPRYFLESHDSQAQVIAKISQLPTLALDSQKIYCGGGEGTPNFDPVPTRMENIEA